MTRNNDYGYIPPGTYGLNGNLKIPLSGNLNASCGCAQQQQKQILLKNTNLPPSYTQGGAFLNIIKIFTVFFRRSINGPKCHK